MRSRRSYVADALRYMRENNISTKVFESVWAFLSDNSTAPFLFATT